VIILASSQNGTFFQKQNASLNVFTPQNPNTLLIKPALASRQDSGI
jgi:hypothetical protein